MDTTLAILMALGIYLVIPVLIGFAIGGIFMLSDRRAKRAKRVQAAVAIAEAREPAKTTVKAGKATS